MTVPTGRAVAVGVLDVLGVLGVPVVLSVLGVPGGRSAAECPDEPGSKEAAIPAGYAGPGRGRARRSA